MYQDDDVTGAAARRGRRTGVLAGVAVVVVLLAAAGIWFALRGSGQHGSPAADGGTGNAAPAPSGSGGPGSVTAPDPGSPSAGAPVGSAAALPRCHTTDLDATLEPSPGGGAAGSVYLDLGLTNRSSHPCAVYGYPGMTLVDSTGRWLPTTLRRDPGQPALVPLQPGKTAWAVVRYTHMPADGEPTPCQPAAAGVAVTPPDETSQLTVDRKLDDVCQHGQMSVSPLSATRGVQ